MTIPPCKNPCQMLIDKMKNTFVLKTQKDQGLYTQDEVDALLDAKSDDDHGHAEGSFIVGQILMYAGAFLPDGFLWCNGETFDAIDYADLYSVVGYTYGVDGGDPKTPNFQDAFPFGASISTPRGEEGGEKEHTLIIAEMPTHNHNYYSDTSGTVASHAMIVTTEGQIRTQFLLNRGGQQPHNNMPPYLAVPFIIFAGNVT